MTAAAATAPSRLWKVAGFVAILLLLGTRSSAQAAQRPPSSASLQEGAAPVKHLGELVFHSDSVDSPAATIGRLGASLFLGPDLFVFADALERTMNFVHTNEGRIVAVGGHGRGPGEFQVIGGAFRDGRGNVVVDDWTAFRTTVLDPNGNVIRTETYDVSGLNGGPGVPRVIGMTRDGALVVRDSDPWIMPRPDGLYRPTVWFVGLDSSSRSYEIARGYGQESVRVNRSVERGFAFGSRPVPFAHELFGVFRDDKLYIADTSTDSVVVASTDGSVLRTIPLPLARIASEEDLALWREQEITSVRNRRNAPSFVDADDEIKWIREATGNKASPRAGGMFVDIAGRLWVQRYAMPTDSAAYWEQWAQGGEAPTTLVRLPRDEKLLDAVADIVLTSSASGLGVSKVAVWKLAGAP